MIIKNLFERHLSKYFICDLFINREVQDTRHVQCMYLQNLHAKKINNKTNLFLNIKGIQIIIIMCHAVSPGCFTNIVVESLIVQRSNPI